MAIVFTGRRRIEETNPETENIEIQPQNDKVSVFNSVSEALEALHEYEVKTTDRYVQMCCPKNFGATGNFF